MAMRKRMIGALYVASVCLLTGCGWLAEVGQPPQRILLDMRDSGTTVQGEVGDHLIIILAANPSTGYDWVQTGGDPQILGISQQKFVPLGAVGDVNVGQGGVDVLDFLLGHAGTTQLTLGYKKGTSQPVGTFAITIESVEPTVPPLG
jgi:predicted secreted protein